MSPAVVEITGFILLELKARDHDGLWSLGGIGGKRIPLRIGNDQRQPLTIRGPGILRNAARHIGQTLGLPPGPIQDPDLIDLASVLAAREKRQIPAIGTPARRAFIGFAFGQPQSAAPVPAGHPHVAVRAVPRRVHGRNRVRHPGTVGGNFRAADFPHLVEVRDRQLSRSFNLPHRGSGQYGSHQESEGNSRDHHVALPG
jgi:hypothetical protein